MMERVVFLDRATIAPHIAIRPPSFGHVWQDFERTAPGEVVARLREATIAVTNKAPISATDLVEAPALRMIAVAATGTDIIDLEASRERGIVVSNVRGYAVRTVPEHVFALILSLTLRRSLFGYCDDVARGEWQRQGQFSFFNHPVNDLHGSRLGIVGGGDIGTAVADVGRGFGMKPVFALRRGGAHQDPERPGYRPFDEVIRSADVLTLHCPLTEETRDMIDLAVFERMKEDAILINASRGGLVKDGDLVAALERGLIGGAAIDVLDQEPPDADHPLFALVGHPKFILTPHMAWASTQAMQTLADQVIDNLENFVAGRPSNRVV